jgi:dTDP-4-amino-4,6-dideoxygalactose transaminase
MDNSLKQRITEFLGTQHIVPVGRGALGIYAALRAWNSTGIVAVPSAVCHDVIAAILMAEWTPFFCDVNKETGFVSKNEWLRAFASGANAAIVVHLYGNAANVDEVNEIFSNGLVIDDAAQALGAKLNASSMYAGTMGNVGLISFGYSKHIHVGGAALLCRDEHFAKACTDVLKHVAIATVQDVRTSEDLYRSKFNVALHKLRSNQENSGFMGILDGYFQALKIGWNNDWSERIERSLSTYLVSLTHRQEKMHYWLKVINGTQLVPVGMQTHSAPWRFSCRLPGCHWKLQYDLGNSLRSKGLQVSHWYLPAHWLISIKSPDLSGSQALAQEVFQFWVDDSIEIEQILHYQNYIQEIFDI